MKVLVVCCIILYLLPLLGCGVARPETLKSDSEIVIDSFDSSALKLWDIVWFAYMGSNKSNLLLSSKKNGCIDLSLISRGDKIDVGLKRMYSYVPVDDTIGIRLNDRFDVKVNEMGKDFIFQNKVLVYTCLD